MSFCLSPFRARPFALRRVPRGEPDGLPPRSLVLRHLPEGRGLPGRRRRPRVPRPGGVLRRRRGQQMTGGKKLWRTNMCLLYVERAIALHHPPPTNNSGVQKWKFSWNMYTLHTCFFVRLEPTRRCLLTKISASELSLELIKSALLVGADCQSCQSSPLAR